MTPAAFIAKWRSNVRNERAASQEHFLDLCALLGEATPNSDPTGAAYAFEKGATKASGGEGWADVWRRGRFAWEYTVGTCFGTFPFPERLTPDRPAAAYAGDLRAEAIAVAVAARALVARDHWQNPPELVERVPEVVAGFPDRLVARDAAAEAVLRRRTLTALYNTRGTPEGAWLDGLHAALDAAVAAAYGWDAGLGEDAVLSRLLALNLARAGAARG